MMRLTAPARRGGAVSGHGNAPTTAPGYENPNRQQVIARTGAPSVTRANQTIYHLRCRPCGFDYGCNGMDIKDRLCPRCQQGVVGEPLPERPPSLFEGL
jgi:hypothetical protein